MYRVIGIILKLVFEIFEKRGGSNFFHKKGSVGKKKGGGINYFHTN